MDIIQIAGEIEKKIKNLEEKRSSIKELATNKANAIAEYIRCFLW